MGRLSYGIQLTSDAGTLWYVIDIGGLGDEPIITLKAHADGFKRHMYASEVCRTFRISGEWERPELPARDNQR